MQILLIEDNQKLAQNIAAVLGSEQHTVTTAQTLGAADEVMSQQEFDAIILDLSLPDGDGSTWCAKVRDDGLMTPILMLTARIDLADKVGGLDRGADDYLTKPFLMDELLARLRAITRRDGRQKSRIYQSKNFSFDLASNRAQLGQKPLNLTPKETRILNFLITHRGQTQSAVDMYEHVWGNTTDMSFSETLKVHIARLRQKIGNGIIVTVPGRGYCVE